LPGTPDTDYRAGHFEFRHLGVNGLVQLVLQVLAERLPAGAAGADCHGADCEKQDNSYDELQPVLSLRMVLLHRTPPVYVFPYRIQQFCTGGKTFKTADGDWSNALA
jgi:hypothetical protein